VHLGGNRVIAYATNHVATGKIITSMNRGIAPMRRDIAVPKLQALGAGAALGRRRFGQGLRRSPGDRSVVIAALSDFELLIAALAGDAINQPIFDREPA
jgi:hypothetical protein